jgi:putative FmdB family regulatory protein
MPTYDYECSACGHRFEEFQNMSDPLLRKCPSCGKKKLLRLLGTGAGIIFKGSGFYETDYKQKTSTYASGKKESDAKSGSEPKSDGKSESKTDSKTDSKPETKSESKGESKPERKPAARKDSKKR